MPEAPPIRAQREKKKFGTTHQFASLAKRNNAQTGPIRWKGEVWQGLAEWQHAAAPHWAPTWLLAEARDGCLKLNPKQACALSACCTVRLACILGDPYAALSAALDVHDRLDTLRRRRPKFGGGQKIPTGAIRSFQRIN